MTDSLVATVASPAPFYIAKSNLCLNEKGESVGNGFFANLNFNAGEQVTSRKRPLVGSLDTERLLDTCANCYVWTDGSSTGTRLYVPIGTKVQKCAGCQRLRYCSKTCQKEAWDRGHKYECKIFKPMADRELPKAVLACMELLSRKKHGLISDEEWTLLCRLPSHIDDFKRNGSYANIELMAMGASQFSLTQKLFNRDFVAAMYARILSNSLTLITPTLDPLGIILDSALGSINHSCDPNAYIMMDGPEVSVRTLRAIKKDEEICVSYIDTTNPMHRRQSELQARWFFACRCNKCGMGATRDEDRWVIEPESMSKQAKEAADTLLGIGDYAQGAANHVIETLDQIRATTLEGKAFSDYEAQQRSGAADEAIQTIEDTMRFCRMSGLWPIYRQPYAALRDDLIVNLLSVSKYQAAWMHCAKRYKFVLPKLYPVQFHPVRIVQTWQMAMLAAYLASTEEGISVPDVNMGLLAMMLVKQVLDASTFSHGPTNAFTKSVRRKAEEMSENLKSSVRKLDKEVMDRELELQRDLLMQMADWKET